MNSPKPVEGSGDMIKRIITKSFKAHQDEKNSLADKHPFYAWQCFSLYLDYKTIDFVIENEEHLFSFINLVNYVQTVSNYFIFSPNTMPITLNSLLKFK